MLFLSPSSSGPHLGEPQTSPTQWVVWGEEEQGSAAKFLPQAETEQSGLCDDEGAAPEGAYKRFRRRRKPWRRANSLRPSILNHPGPHCVHRTQWETGRRGRVSRHEGFLQPEVSIVSFCKAAQLGGFAFSVAQLLGAPSWGAPDEPNAVGRLGGGGARERSEVFAAGRNGAERTL